MVHGSHILLLALLLIAADAHRPSTFFDTASGGNEDDSETEFPRQAYVTLVTTPSYAIGAETLAKVSRFFIGKRCVPIFPLPCIRSFMYALVCLSFFLYASLFDGLLCLQLRSRGGTNPQ